LKDVNIPENSMLSFRHALDHGADGVECDVLLTKDNKIVVFHDGFVNRVLEGQGNVSDLTLAEIQAMPFKRVGTIDVPETADLTATWDTLGERLDRVPTLEHLILFCKHRNAKLMIELKETRRSKLLVSMIIALFDKYQLYDTAYVASFNPYHMYLFRHVNANIPTALLYCRDLTQWYHEEGSEEMRLPRLINQRVVRYFYDALLVAFAPTVIADVLGVDIVGPHNILASGELIEDARKRNLVVNMWVVNNELEKAYWKSQDVLVTTDICFPRKSPLLEERKVTGGGKVSAGA
jgi:glycerophosphoryl diester phosphodiesterase